MRPMAKKKAPPSKTKPKRRKAEPAWKQLPKGEQVALRRWRMVEMVAQGKPVMLACHAIAKEFEATVSAVKSDWGRRTAWLPEFVTASHRDIDMVARESFIRMQEIEGELTAVKQSAMKTVKLYKVRKERRIPIIKDGHQVGQEVIIEDDVQSFPAANHGAAVRALGERRQLEELRIRIAGMFYDPDKGGTFDDLTDEDRAKLAGQAAALFSGTVPAITAPYSVRGDIEGLEEAVEIGDGLGTTPEERKASLAELLEDDAAEGGTA